MIIKITPANMNQNTDILDELFMVRYDEFIIRRKWEELDKGSHRDIDDYDDNKTSYIIYKKNGKILAGARLRPTIERHMLDEHFSFLSHNKIVPKGPKIGECSRTFVSRKAPNKKIAFLETIIGVVDLSIEQNYTQLTGVLEPWWLNSYLALGLDPIPLGSPRTYNNLSVMGVKFDVTSEILDNLYKLQQRITPEDLQDQLRKAS